MAARPVKIWLTFPNIDSGRPPGMTRWWGNRASGGGCSIHLRRREVLAVHPDYFQLTGGLERWLYRIARKAVPDKAKVPATRPLRNFAGDLRKMADSLLPLTLTP